jgi:uncharacterized integral membrane protein
MQKSQFLFILSLILAVIVTVFALTNSSPVVINFFFTEFTGSLALVIFLSAMLGALVVMFLGIGRFIGFKLDTKRLNKEKTTLTKEKETLVQQVADLNKQIADLTAKPAPPASTAPTAASAAAPESHAVPTADPGSNADK